MCMRWVGDWTDRNILTPSSSVFSSTSFSFCWAAQSGVLQAHSPLLGAGSLYSILSRTNWPCLWHRVIWLFDTHLLLVDITSAPNSTHPQSRLYPDIFDQMHLLFTQVHLLFDSSAEGQYVTKDLSLPYYTRGRIIGFIPLPRVLQVCKMQTASSRIWTRISYDSNHYTNQTYVYPWKLKISDYCWYYHCY